MTLAMPQAFAPVDPPSRATSEPLCLNHVFSPAHPTLAPMVLHDGVYAVGRAGGGHAVSVDDPRLAPIHAELHVSEGGCTVELFDRHAHGTFVNGERTCRQRLRCGDVVRMGDTVWLVRSASLSHASAIAPLQALPADILEAVLVRVAAPEQTLLSIREQKDTPPTRERVVAVVEQHRGNIRRAALALGRSRKQVYRYLEQYAIDLTGLRDVQSEDAP